MIVVIVGLLVGAAMGVTLMCMVIVGDDKRKTGTCQNVSSRNVKGMFVCSECGISLGVSNMVGDDTGVLFEPRYCPSCGARVVGDK